MPAYFNIRLDTTAPQAPVFQLHGGAATVTDPLVAVLLTTTDPDTTGYQVKIWGDVLLTDTPSIQDTEAASAWVGYGTIVQLRLSDGNGVKHVHAKIRDDVGNETAVLDVVITLDTTAPVVTITVAPDRPKISKVAPWDVSHFTFTADSDITHYEIRVVPGQSSTHDQGTLLHQVDVNVIANTPIPESVTGAELQAAVGPDGDYIVKVFAMEAESGAWSA